MYTAPYCSFHAFLISFYFNFDYNAQIHLITLTSRPIFPMSNGLICAQSPSWIGSSEHSLGNKIQKAPTSSAGHRANSATGTFLLVNADGLTFMWIINSRTVGWRCWRHSGEPGQIDRIWPAGELCRANEHLLMTHMHRLPALSINRQ